MIMKQNDLTLMDFQAMFQTNEACRDHLFAMRFPDGFRCPDCGHDQYYLISSRHLLQCTACRTQTSLTAGTIFHKTRTPLSKWFWAIYLVAHDKRGISALALSRELGVTYKTAWLMLHKIRHAMHERDQEYVLTGIVEVDEAYFGGPGIEPKRGRGTNKTPAIVAISLSDKGKPQYLKMLAVEDVKKETLKAFITSSVDANATIVHDGFGAYQSLAEERSTLTMKFDPVNNPDHMQWLHKAISNAKSFILGTYHGIKGKYMQAYFDEYCYRYNRRKFKSEWFNRLLMASIASSPVPLAVLKG